MDCYTNRSTGKETFGKRDRFETGKSKNVAPVGVSDEVVAFYESAFEAAMTDADYLSAATQAGITTDYMDAVATEEIISQQQAFAESLAQGFWFD